ncbi:hypothetical protein [Pseudoalteromonas sp. MTN2-4]|uniref:hypothetical protein n=1 Tax=Pseudoalteromonas sp. MTN2-4 TaxID=3056555 RepID=UPI0036F3CBEB
MSVLSFATFLVSAHLISFLFISIAAVITFLLFYKITQNTTPLSGTLLLDCADNYIEVHSEKAVSGQVMSANLQLAVLSIQVRTIQQKTETIHFVASSMSEKDWRRMCRFALNERNPILKNDSNI